jgi:hypothetical protein
MKRKNLVPIVLLVILASIFASQSVFAQNSLVTSTVSLSHLNVQLIYPSQVLPGQAATINLTALAKDSFQLTSLTVQVYLADQNDLRPLLSTTVAQNMVMPSGNQITKQIQVSVPSDAPRTSLIALVTESVSVLPASYSYPYAYPNWNGYGNGYGYGTYPYYYYSSPAAYYYYGYPSYTSPSYNSQSTSDNGIAPLSYVLAPTPEYVTLQSQYQQLQSQNQQLQQQLLALQNSTAQKDSTISNLNNLLSSTQGTATLVEVVAVILAIAVVALAALHFKPTRTTDTESHPSAKTEEKTTGV